MNRRKPEKLNLAEWGNIEVDHSIHQCKKCGGKLENCNAFGVIYLGFCRKCRKFWGICIDDVTSRLSSKFKKQFTK